MESSTWKISFSSLGVLWLLHGLPLRFLAALGQRKFPWSIRRRRVGDVLRAATSEEGWHEAVVASSQLVLLVTLDCYPLVSFLKENFNNQHHLRIKDQCIFIRAFRARWLFSGLAPSGLQQSLVLMTLTTIVVMGLSVRLPESRRSFCGQVMARGA